MSIILCSSESAGAEQQGMTVGKAAVAAVQRVPQNPLPALKWFTFIIQTHSRTLRLSSSLTVLHSYSLTLILTYCHTLLLADRVLIKAWVCCVGFEFTRKSSMAKRSAKSAHRSLIATGDTEVIEQPTESVASTLPQVADTAVPMVERSEGKSLSPIERRWLDTIVEMRDKPTDFSRSFFARQLVQCTLPHSNPGQTPIWERVNGDLKLSIRPYFATDRGFLYPYGTLPRVFLSWLVTEAVRTKSRRIHLGKSFSDFLRLLGLNASNGGKRSDTVRLRDQLERLLRATISFEQTTPGSKRKSWIDMQIAQKL